MDSRSVYRRTFAVTAFLVVVFSALSVRVVYVQVVNHDRLSKIAKTERLKREYLPATRGLIFDRHGEPLVQNRHVRDVIADRYHLVDIHVCRKAVAVAEGLSVRQVARELDDNEARRRFIEITDRVLDELLGNEGIRVRDIVAEGAGRDHVVVCRNLEFKEAEKMRLSLLERGIGGFSFEDAMERHYPNPDRLVQVLGYTDADNVGREGIEGALDKQLAGEAGYRNLERTRRSSEVLSGEDDLSLPVDGANVELTINMGLQEIVETALQRAVLQCSPEKIMAVFMDPGSGEVLAMASRPHFDQETRKGIRKIHPVADRYEPGSTFKIVALAAAFDKELITLDSVFFCHNGRYSAPGLFLRDHRAFSYLSSREILSQSSNIGAFFIAKKVEDRSGVGTFDSYIKNFGFGSRTGIELTAEAAGLVTGPDDRAWSRTSLSRIAMGYEVDVTALQMASALSVIANGGNLMKPQIIQKVSSAEGEVIYQLQPKKIRRVISEQAAGMMVNALTAVVADGGTGQNAMVDGFVVAGKTGTAKKLRTPRNKGYYHGRYVVSFMGFLPAENPRLVGIIVVDDPKNASRYGGTVAAPIFSEIATAAMPCMGVKPAALPRRMIKNVRRKVKIPVERY
ncbi:MAG: penicillin-binding protein 2 [Verrucomicrobiaceae bacterium]|nr:penicillin-binding protein 2 [Verrucomicrobiaceae bacterium]